jgi:hypothetical protein
MKGTPSVSINLFAQSGYLYINSTGITMCEAVTLEIGLQFNLTHMSPASNTITIAIRAILAPLRVKERK